MRNINLYIIEKLKLNKDTKATSVELENIKELIEKWLDIHSYFDMSPTDFKILLYDDLDKKSKARIFSDDIDNTKAVILQFPKNTNPYDLREAIGKNIAEKIDKELHLDYFWELQEIDDNCLICFSDDIVL